MRMHIADIICSLSDYLAQRSDMKAAVSKMGENRILITILDDADKDLVEKAVYGWLDRNTIDEIQEVNFTRQTTRPCHEHGWTSSLSERGNPMYNMDFCQQLEASRRHLFGNTGEPPSKLDAARYMPPPGVEPIPCIQDENGEWVPDPEALKALEGEE